LGLCDFYLPKPAFRLLTRGFGTSISRKPSGTSHPASHASGIDHHSPSGRHSADLRRAAAALRRWRTRHGWRRFGNRRFVLSARGGQHPYANHCDPRAGLLHHEHVVDIAFVGSKATHFDSQSGRPRNGRAGQSQRTAHFALPRRRSAANPSERQPGCSRCARTSRRPADPLSPRGRRDFPGMNLLVGTRKRLSGARH
jgi:hypothetical protein